MGYAGVLFDLFGTLVANARGDEYRASLAVTARSVGADAKAFYDAWTDAVASHRRFTGQFGSQRECIRFVCGLIGVTPAEAGLDAAAAERARFEAKLLATADEHVPTLQTLRWRGLRLGLISSCSADAPHLFRATRAAEQFDVLAFSCEVGLNKPDARFYQFALDRLGVGAARCLYVGDGAGNELTGAQAVGMDAVLICRPGEDDIVFARDEARLWTGRRIRDPADVLDLLDGHDCPRERDR